MFAPKCEHSAIHDACADNIDQAIIVQQSPALLFIPASRRHAHTRCVGRVRGVRARVSQRLDEGPVRRRLRAHKQVAVIHAAAMPVDHGARLIAARASTSDSSAAATAIATASVRCVRN